MVRGAAVPRAPAIVGRDAELARAREAIAHASVGTGCAVVITGEPGIGKSTVGREIVRLAAARSFQLLIARCDPLSERLAYAPVVGALGRALRELPIEDRMRIVDGLPALGRLIPGLDLPVDELIGDVSLDRIRLFESILRVLDRLTRRSPVVLFVDDLQWADRSTLELLAYVTRDLAALPLLIVTTIPVDIAAMGSDGTQPFGQLVASMRHAGLVDQIQLRALSDEETIELVASLLGDSADARLSRYLAERSQGNPLFVQVLLGQLIDQAVVVDEGGRWVVRKSLDGPTPALIRDILAARLAPLDALGRRLIEAIALAGDWVDGSILEAALAVHPVETASRPIRLGLVAVRDGPDPQFSLAHPLLGAVVREVMPAAEQRRWHAALADAYRRVRPDDVERQALHAQRSLPFGDPHFVLDASLRAGELALSRSAGTEAASHFVHALDLAQRYRPAAVARALVGLGEARQRVGDRVGAGNAWSEAIVALGPEIDRRDIARLHLRAATALSDVEFAAADRHVDAGLAVLHDSDPVAQSELELELELLLIAATTAHRRIDPAGVHSTVARILDVGRHLTTERARALSSAARLLARLEERDYLGAERELGAQDLLAAGRPLLVARHLNALALVAAVKGDLPTLRQLNDQAVHVARQVGIPSWDFRTHLNGFIAALYGADWDRAEEAVAEALLLGERISHPLVTVVGRLMSARLLAYRGDYEAASASCRVDDLIAAGAPSIPVRALSEVELGIVELERGDVDAAARLLERRPLPMGTTMPPWDLVADGEALARLGRASAAADVSRRLATMAGPGSWPAAMAARINGLAAAAEARTDEAVQRLDEAAAAFRRLSMPFEEARAGIELAALAGRAGGIDVSLTDRLGGWLATFERLGATPYAHRARRILESLDHLAVPAPHPGRTELTPRQLEIAELVATGMSNAEIADRLFLSVRTVTSHLDHIYTRLGIGSRAALAAYAVETRGVMHE